MANKHSKELCEVLLLLICINFLFYKGNYFTYDCNFMKMKNYQKTKLQCTCMLYCD